MKFLLDVCASSQSLHSTLAGLGHDVLSSLERDPCATDEAVLALANDEQRVLITEDKDFGELVFVRRLPHPCIIRFVDMPVAEKVAAMRELLERHAGRHFDRGDTDTCTDTLSIIQRATSLTRSPTTTTRLPRNQHR